jgi:branched-chain amino acid transport system substrate-binding protein
MITIRRAVLPIAIVIALGVSGCAAGGDSGSDEPIVVGATLPLTGSLEAFGTSLQTGYQLAVDEVNEAGGITIEGAERTVELVVQDNASTADKASEQARDLVLDSGAVALLGPATPPLSIPVSIAAEQLEIPTLITITPIQAWKGGAEDGWNWSYDVFFDELQMTDTQFEAADLVETNHKVALFTDQEEDGIVMGGLWAEKAAAFGYEIVSHEEFPVGNTNFSSQVSEAKASGAEVVIAQVIPPDGIALLREMKAQGYDPKVLFIEKGGNTGGYPAITDGLADGVLAANWFAEGMGLDREAEFIEAFAGETGGVNSDLGTIVYGYTIAKIMLEAIATAGSLDAQAISDAIAATEGEYPAGHVAFDDDHAAALHAVQTQWVGENQVLVLDADGKAANPIDSPTPGLR